MTVIWVSNNVTIDSGCLKIVAIIRRTCIARVLYIKPPGYLFSKEIANIIHVFQENVYTTNKHKKKKPILWLFFKNDHVHQPKS